MANIFSGILGGGGGGSDAAGLAKYKADLEEQQKLKEYQQRNQNLIDSSRSYASATQDMTPERQRQMKLFQMMAGQETMGDKGMEGMMSGFKQRGTTIADMLKQDKSVESANAKQQYKVDNPEPPTEPSKTAFTKYFIKQWRDDPKNDQKMTDSEIAQIGLRQEQFLNQKTQFGSTVTGKSIPIMLTEAGVAEARANKIGPDLNNFYSGVESAGEMLYQMQNQRNDIKKLFGDTSGWSTAWGTLMNWIPGSSQKDWDELKSTVVSNIGLDKILSLKASSAQGATGLGALNEAELMMLQNHMGSLEQARSPKSLKDVMVRIDKTLERIQDRKMRQLTRTRREFNTNKKIIGMESDLPEGQRDWITPGQEYLFTNGIYKQPESRSTLGDETREERLNRLLKQ